ncbi:hypothetical protein MesoLj131c_10380 [Mesorhizobium sp. 131-3-5]|nr:hypothetical protein MesoLj131b_11410 [Mesorhizobium sp. 131-2-5]BCH06780.1 hypothetical protein MesoLj131c_10380 [Mesorhizobium sp. 131-3-5]
MQERAGRPGKGRHVTIRKAHHPEFDKPVRSKQETKPCPGQGRPAKEDRPHASIHPGGRTATLHIPPASAAT